MLRGGLIAALLSATATLALAAAAPPDSVATAPRGSVATAPRDSVAAAPRDSARAAEPWFERNVYRWFARSEPAVVADDAALARAEIRFLPFAVRPIRAVEIRGRKAFGTILPDSTAGPRWLLGPARLLTSPLEAFLNDLYAQTDRSVIEDHLLFAAGARLDPFALADSERLLREAAFASDVRLEVVPIDADTTAVDVYVLVRDRWPYGADLKVHDSRWWDAQVFDRNLAGRGLDLDVALRARDDREPSAGYAAQLRAANLGGRFVDAAVFAQDAWDRDELRFSALREFRHLDVRVVGGLGAAAVTDHVVLGDPSPGDLAWRAAEAWIGRSFVVDHDRYGARPRLRLVPTAGVFDLRYRRRPQAARYPHATQFLAGATLVGWESYPTQLVRGFGETEDIPAGVWLSVVGGFERGETADRLYHGASLALPTYSARGYYATTRFALGGYRRHGRLEDAVLDVAAGGFGPLRRRGSLAWRSSASVGYTRGVRRTLSGGLGLDGDDGVRGIDAPGPRGDQRLRFGLESVVFLPPSLMGFRFAVFGFGDGGFVGGERDALLTGPLYASVGAGLRIKNPGLVFPTLQARVARVRDDDGWRTEFRLGTTSDSFFAFGRPGVRPATVPYR